MFVYWIRDLLTENDNERYKQQFNITKELYTS